MFLETICLLNGKVQNVDAHVKRMESTGSYYGFEPPELPELEEMLTPGMDVNTKLKCSITYHTEINTIVFEHYEPMPVSTLKLVKASPDYAFKFADRTTLNILMDKRAGCDQILIIRNGLVTDTTISNVVFSKDDDLFTPHLPLLNGTKRQKLLKEGRIKEIEINVDNIKEYDKVYLINALIDIEDNISLPVTQIFE